MATGKFFRELHLPQQKHQDDGFLFPAVLSPNLSTAVELCVFKEEIRAHKPWLDSLLQKTGAILFRGFPVTSPSDFNNVVEAFGFSEALYVGGLAARTKVVDRVYTTNESPLDEGIPFHHELAYGSDYPTKLFFFCEEEPGKGGETPIVLSHIVYEKMKERHPHFVALLEEQGLKYIKESSEENNTSTITGSSWKSAFKTNDKNVAKERAAKLGMKLEWTGTGARIIIGPVPATRFDKESKRKTWFNSLVVSCSGPVSERYRNGNVSVELGNGDPFPDDAVEGYLKILEEECVAIPWKKGDVLLVNNLMVLHGRRPLLRPPRRILASLCK